MIARIALLIGLLISPAMGAESPAGKLMNSLLSPGALIKGHQSFEGNCTQCHEPGKGVPDAKCVACHKEIRLARETKSGFHGLSARSCIQCHQDHRGRDFDSTVVEPKVFDHALTGFALKGKHEELQCASCHVQKRGEAGRAVLRPDGIRFIDAAPSCVGCHRKDDIHQFKGKWASPDCGECHKSETSWKEAAHFDHAREARYPLVGSHAKLACIACHTASASGPPRYAWPNLKAAQCLACHDDHHGKQLSPRFRGGDCTACHTQEHWKIDAFDHAKSGFALQGAHAALGCVECHKQTGGKELASPAYHFAGLSRNCVACHKDFHGFDSRRTKLLGELARCETCHTETAWKPAPKFDHAKDTRYPIQGAHLGLGCVECHVPEKRNPALRVYHWNSFAARTCETCHQSPHLHIFPKKLLAKKCTDCHTDQGWKLKPGKGVRFDHDTSTRFPLTGAHRQLQCASCHQAQGRGEVFRFPHLEQGFCVDCHKTVHVGQFSELYLASACTACHTTDDWTHRKTFIHESSGFELRGAHATIACVACHVPTQAAFEKSGHAKDRFLFPGVGAEDCVACHRDPHQGRNGPNCATCHTEKSWKQTADFHKNFSLTGTHLHVACAECHKDWRALSGQSQNCLLCHQKDDIHNHSLPSCGQCHTQQAWDTITFKHSLSSFPLRGYHRTLDCAACHSEGIYTGTPSQCAACHRGEALGFTGNPNHQLLINRDCSECHNQFSFH